MEKKASNYSPAPFSCSLKCLSWHVVGSLHKPFTSLKCTVGAHEQGQPNCKCTYRCTQVAEGHRRNFLRIAAASCPAFCARSRRGTSRGESRCPRGWPGSTCRTCPRWAGATPSHCRTAWPIPRATNQTPRPVTNTEQHVQDRVNFLSRKPPLLASIFSFTVDV